MKTQYSRALKIFLAYLCGIGLLTTVLSFSPIQNVRAEMDMEDIMESILEDIQEEVRETTKKQVRQETREVIIESVVEPTVTTTGTATGGDVSGNWLLIIGPGESYNCTFSQTGSTFSGSCVGIFPETWITNITGGVSGSFYSFTYTGGDGVCTSIGTGSATLSSDSNSFTLSAVDTSGTGPCPLESTTGTATRV